MSSIILKKLIFCRPPAKVLFAACGQRYLNTVSSISIDITPGTPSSAPAPSDQRLTESCMPVASPVMLTANSAAMPPKALRKSAEKPRLSVTANTVIASAAAAATITKTVFIPVDMAIPAFLFVADGYIAAFKSLLLCELQKPVVSALERFYLIYRGFYRVVVLAVFKPQICRVHLLFERPYVHKQLFLPVGGFVRLFELSSEQIFESSNHFFVLPVLFV